MLPDLWRVDGGMEEGWLVGWMERWLDDQWDGLWDCSRDTHGGCVADREVGECVDPEGNGVTTGRGAEGARPTQWGTR
jgi:hypothetical protein